ncbi:MULTISPECIES: DUF5779 family protein [Natrinema]|uniref:Cell division protein SepF n=4 Tax=Natrinema TaxID=88723 RepID=L9ZKG7_NATA2|nr:MULTISPECIES: DUF5779 family protein [Natrinema]ELY75956.1 hypothetical protein C487_12663 [Natrinema pallidum DSM 3751]ELY86859.1 hypothetical protein C485_08082 [Natrinema altunense JCM 12890]QCW02763.1 hypothetical protein FGF80_05730 [Natrinema pallidum]RZH66818.1 hypothetical protein ELS17_13635 [Natrinema altunense]
MSDFDLDLRAVEEHIDDELDLEGSLVLGVLDGETPADEWLETISNGNVLILNVDGDVNELAAGFARDIKESGGELVHFRGFLIVTPPGVDVSTERL